MKTLTLPDGVTRSFNDTVARDAIQNKVDKVSGKGLSTNDYTTAEKNKLAGIADGATANIGTVTGVRLNNITYEPTNGLINLGAIGGDGSSGGSENHDFAHTANSVVSAATCTVAFPAGRSSVMLSASADVGLSIVCNNFADNYVWIKNTGEADIDILIASVTLRGNSVANVYVPADGISVPAGKVCEIGIVCNADGAFITSRNDLTL